jgi:hypothetical protein
LTIPASRCVRAGLESAIEEYSSFSLGQVEGSYKLWQSNEFKDDSAIGPRAFEEIFSGLFSDCESHFESLKDHFQPMCKLKRVFILLALFAHETKTLKKVDFMMQVFLLSINEPSGSSSISDKKAKKKNDAAAASDDGNKQGGASAGGGGAGDGEDDGSITMDEKQMQEFINFVLECVNLLYTVQTPTSYKVDYFVSYAVLHYQARQHKAILEPLAEGEDPAHILNSTQTSGVMLTPTEFWLCMQDMVEAVAFMGAFQDPVKKERTSSPSFGISKGGGNNQRDDPVAGTDGTTNTSSSSIGFLEHSGNPMWLYRAVDMVDDSFFEHMPTLDITVDMFTALEHSVLSTSHVGGQSSVLPLLRGRESEEEGGSDSGSRLHLNLPAQAGARAAAAVSASSLGSSASRAGLSSISISNSSSNGNGNGNGNGSGSHYPPNGGIGGYNYPPGNGNGHGKHGVANPPSTPAPAMVSSASRAGLSSSVVAKTHGSSAAGALAAAAGSSSRLGASASRAIVGGGRATIIVAGTGMYYVLLFFPPSFLSHDTSLTIIPLPNQ